MEYNFKAAFGDTIKDIKITNPNGGGTIFHLMIENYYCGSINKMSDGWHVYFNTDEFSAADETIILDLLKDLKAI